MRLALYADRIELPRAVLPREPYLVSISTSEHSREPLQVRSEPVKVRRGHPAAMVLPLWPPGDVGSWLHCSILLMESDEGLRRAGSVVETAMALLQAMPADVALATAFGPSGVRIRQIAGGLAKLLRQNGDDELLRADLRLDAGNGYRAGQSWTLESPSRPAARLSLRCIAVAAPVTDDELANVGAIA